MKTASEIEAELHKRFSEQVFVGMSTTDYHSALAHVIIRYAAEHLSAPCEYEIKPYPSPSELPAGAYGNAGPMGAWCKTHGWYCPGASANGQSTEKK